MLTYNLLILLGMLPIFAEPLHPEPCRPTLAPAPICDNCTLDQLAQKIRTLKERPIEFSALPSQKEYQKNIMTLTTFLTTLERAAKTLATRCSNNNLWLGKKSVYTEMPEVFTLRRPFVKPLDDVRNFPFKPYAQKLMVKPGAKIAFFGDLHGSAHSFIRDLEKLKKLGYLKNDFTLSKDFYIALLGDYIDRGIYGIEVMYTLARLLIANPEQVIVARGNHEDYILAPDFRKKHSSEEEKDNAPSLIDELYRKFTMTEADELAIYRFYETLPLVFYLGCGNKHHDFIQCCHGGLEIGYNPSQFLQAAPEIKFDRITQLARRTNFAKLSKRSQNNIKKGFDLDYLCGEMQDFVPKAPFYRIEGTKHVSYVGFMWNDFFVDPREKVKPRRKNTGWTCGRELTKDVLSWGNSDNVKLHGIFRAHQHNNETGGPMLDKLCCSKGMANVWGDGLVFTFVSAPNSKLEDTGEECFTYDAFVIITTAEQFADWSAKQYTQDNGFEETSWKVRPRLLKKSIVPQKVQKRDTFSQAIQL